MSLIERLEQKAKTLADWWENARIEDDEIMVRLEDVQKAVKQATTPLTTMLDNYPVKCPPEKTLSEYADEWDEWFEDFLSIWRVLVGEQTEQKETTKP